MKLLPRASLQPKLTASCMEWSNSKQSKRKQNSRSKSKGGGHSYSTWLAFCWYTSRSSLGCNWNWPKIRMTSKRNIFWSSCPKSPAVATSLATAACATWNCTNCGRMHSPLSSPWATFSRSSASPNSRTNWFYNYVFSLRSVWTNLAWPAASKPAMFTLWSFTRMTILCSFRTANLPKIWSCCWATEIKSRSTSCLLVHIA